MSAARVIGTRARNGTRTYDRSWITDGTTIDLVAEWMTGPAGSWCTTSALPQITMTMARRIGSAVSGSYVELSRSTRRRLQIDAVSWRVGGWVSTLCRDDAVAGPVNPAAAPEIRWLRRLLPCAMNPPRIVHHDSPPIARLSQVRAMSNRLTARAAQGPPHVAAPAMHHNGRRWNR